MVEIVNSMKAVISSCASTVFSLFSYVASFLSPQLNSPPLSISNIEMQVHTISNKPKLSSLTMESKEPHHDLGKIILGFSFPAAIALLVLAFQSNSGAQVHLPSSFHFLSLAVLLAFSTSLIGIMLRHSCTAVARVLEKTSIVCAALAFFVAMEITLPMSLKWVVWIICAFSLFIFLLYNCIHRA